MDLKRVIKVFLASPMDLPDEREQFRRAIGKINATIGKASDVEYEVICWENDTVPGFGEDAQDVVNKQIKAEYDIFVCMFKSRLGTPTGRYASGTVEEYERAIHRRIHRTNLDIMAYFFECDDLSSEMLEFKRKVSDDGALFWDVKKGERFEDVAFNHFARKLLDYKERNNRKESKKEENTTPKIKNAVSVAMVAGSDVLVVRRSFSAKVGPGMWQLPGGKTEPGESEIATAIREVEEETGYSVSQDKLVKVNTFSTCLNNDPSRPFKMTLFMCRIDTRFEVRINDESSGYEWLSLESCDFGGMAFLGINRQMLTAVWREIYLTSALRALSDCFSAAEVNELPKQIPLLSAAESNAAYALLSLLGVVRVEDKITLTSGYSKMILKEIISILSSGEAIFGNDNNALIRGKKLSVEDMKQLRAVREQAFYSNKALASVLSCKAELPKSTRAVCDTLIFGSYNERLYLLLRWDFFANKYQVICKGINADSELDYEEKAKYVINNRLHGTEAFFDFEFIKSCDVYHFSAGSIENDPILRRYLIDVVLLQTKKKFRSDVLRTVEAINEETLTAIDFSYEIERNSAIEFNYYLWCDLEELIRAPGTYRSEKVRGIDEIIKNIGASVLRELGYSAIELSEEHVSDECFEECKQKFKEKYKDN